MKRLMTRSHFSRSTPMENTTSTTATSDRSDPFEFGSSTFAGSPPPSNSFFGRDLPCVQPKMIDVSVSPYPNQSVGIAVEPRDSVAIILDWDDTLFPTSWMRRVQKKLFESYKDNNATFKEYHDRQAKDTGVSDMELWTMFDFRHLSSPDRILLRKLELSAIELLRTCVQKSSKLYIITNAQLPWVQLSARTFMPKLLQAVMKHEVTIISARDSYMAFGKDCDPEATPEVWKLTAFQALTATFLEQAHTSSAAAASRTLTSAPLRGSSASRNRSSPAKRWWPRPWRSHHSRSKSTASAVTTTMELERCIVVSIGDSECERAALLKCRDAYFQHAFFKSIKLVESPHPNLLKREQDYVRRTLEQVVSIPESIDIIFVPPTAQTVS